MDQLIQSLLPNNDRFYFEHDLETNTFTVKEDPDQAEKTDIVTHISAADKKLEKILSTKEKEKIKKIKKKNIKKLKKIREKELARALAE